ncbi:hypothetical protein BC6_00075 [Bacillus phage BC-6]|nr:hypothetical protein BC6_00075 [Bacillus phage BC-6]
MRTIRYRQVLRQRIGNTGGLYKTQVRLQQLFWNEDQAFAWTIPQVREIHSSLGIWDKLTDWRSWVYDTDKEKFIKGKFNRIILRSGKVIYPKANYKSIKKTRAKFKAYMEKKSQEDRWKEQEQRTLEFFEREGC